MDSDVDFAYSFFEPSRELVVSPERVAGVSDVGLMLPSSRLEDAHCLPATRGSENAVEDFDGEQFNRCLLALFFVSVSGAFLFLSRDSIMTFVFLVAAVATMFWVGWREFAHEE